MSGFQVGTAPSIQEQDHLPISAWFPTTYNISDERFVQLCSVTIFELAVLALQHVQLYLTFLVTVDQDGSASVNCLGGTGSYGGTGSFTGLACRFYTCQRI